MNLLVIISRNGRISITKINGKCNNENDEDGANGASNNRVKGLLTKYGLRSVPMRDLCGYISGNVADFQRNLRHATIGIRNNGMFFFSSNWVIFIPKKNCNNCAYFFPKKGSFIDTFSHNHSKSVLLIAVCRYSRVFAIDCPYYNCNQGNENNTTNDAPDNVINSLGVKTAASRSVPKGRTFGQISSNVLNFDFHFGSAACCICMNRLLIMCSNIKVFIPAKKMYRALSLKSPKNCQNLIFFQRFLYNWVTVPVIYVVLIVILLFATSTNLNSM